MEKILSVLAQVGIVSGVVLICALHLCLMAYKVIGKDNYENTEWIKKNGKFYFYSVLLPYLSLLHPIREEMLSRFILVVFFSEISILFWIMNIALSAYGALCHFDLPFMAWRWGRGGKSVGLDEKVRKEALEDVESSNPFRRKFTVLLFLYFFFCFLILGFVAVWAQSFVLALAIHCTFNFVLLFSGSILKPNPGWKKTHEQVVFA